MTIEKGRQWGTPGRLPDDGVVVGSDAEARAVVESARRADRPVPVIGLLGGDLCRTLGGTGDARRLRSPQAMTFPIDIVSVVVDGRPYWFVAHLVARNRLWTRTWVAMNAQWLGTLNLAPRSHPDDAVVDTFDARLAPGDLWKVRARAHHGAHLPHPGITERRVSAIDVDLGRSREVRLDGTVVGVGRHLRLRVEPDAGTVVV